MGKKLTMEQRQEAYREMVRNECAVLGIDIQPRGEALHLWSKHVDLLVVDLSWVREADLKVGETPVWRTGNHHNQQM